MAKLSQKQIRALAKSIVEASPSGIRFSDLKNRIAELHPETPDNTIRGSIWDLDKTLSGEIEKPSRGVFAVAASSTPATSPATVASTGSGATTRALSETDFYQSFAEWLKEDLDEATVAIPLGGNGLGRKWGTPDVVGTFKPQPSDRFKFDIEIITAEIKTDPSESITAFGQAAAYRLFSHKVYLVMPSTVPEQDRDRLESLALLFGMGLVEFDLDLERPNYRVRVRAQRFVPDMFYVNEFAERLHNHDKSAFNGLFQ